MKGYITVVAMACIFLACAQTQDKNHTAAIDQVVTEEPNPQYSSILKQHIPDSAAIDFIPAYDKLKSKITAKRNVFFQAYERVQTEHEKQIVLDSANKFLQEALVNNVFPFWYGTAWDFNGITDNPQRGYIACGYFVSTTLKHCGVNLNRYKVAQQYSHSIVKTVCSEVAVYTNTTDLLNALKAKPNQLYVIGLDNHVGFIAKTDAGITFIHASYFGDAVVESERAAESQILAMSKKYVIGNLSGNKDLIKQWLKNSVVSIIP
jgi:hypothetical protein